MPNQNNLPLFFEELKIKEETTIPELITQLKQQIPVNFVCLEIKERNYQCSTMGWKEPVCERYGFTWQNQWIQLDIPHSLLEKLGLKVKKDLPTNFYLDPDVLKKELVCGGITIKEGEIILIVPTKIIVKDQEVQTDLSSARIKELEENEKNLKTKIDTSKMGGSWENFGEWLNSGEVGEKLWSKFHWIKKGQYDRDWIGIVRNFNGLLPYEDGKSFEALALSYYDKNHPNHGAVKTLELLKDPFYEWRKETFAYRNFQLQKTDNHSENYDWKIVLNDYSNSTWQDIIDDLKFIEKELDRQILHIESNRLALDSPYYQKQEVELQGYKLGKQEINSFRARFPNPITEKQEIVNHRTYFRQKWGWMFRSN